MLSNNYCYLFSFIVTVVFFTTYGNLKEKFADESILSAIFGVNYSKMNSKEIVADYLLNGS